MADLDPRTRSVVASRFRAGDSIADLADDYGLDAALVLAAIEQAPEQTPAPRRRHRWDLLGGSFVVGDETSTIERLRCRRCGLQARRVPTRTGGSLRMEVLGDEGSGWIPEISECPGEREQEQRAASLAERVVELEAQVADLEQLREGMQSEIANRGVVIEAQAQKLATIQAAPAPAPALPTIQRRVPPLERQGTIKRFDVGGVHGYLTIGHYPDGAPCEVFLAVAKDGSTIRGLLDGWARMFSIALQYGVPLEVLVEKVKGARFEPSGWTDDPEITPVASILDYVVRWLERRYLPAPAATGEQPQGEQL